MTDILCNWLNNEVQLDENITAENFAETFSSGYVIGLILQKYELLDDFDQLINKNSSDAKLNNFLILEPILKLIGVSFNNEIAHEVMSAKPSVLINLMYQLFIILERKKKSNITAMSIKTMQAPAVTKFQEMETLLFQEKLKRTTPRQSDLNMQQAIHKYKEHQFNMKLKAERDRILSAEGHKADTQEHRKQRLERSKFLQKEQEEQKRKIDAAIVQIPKPPANKTLAAINQKKKDRIRREAEKSLRELDEFEHRKSMEVTRKQIKGEDSSNQDESYSRDESYSMSDTTPTENGRLLGSETQTRQGTFLTATSSGAMDQRAMVMEYLQPKSNEEYIGRIRSRLESDKEARVAREKRRRQVLMNCLKTHFEQEETERENMIAMRLLRQSQMERRIAVQLLQVRNEKTVMKNNRLEREQQYQQRREKEFILAMDKEQEMLRQFRLENEDRLKAEMELYEEKRRQFQMSKYEKHYEMAQKIVYDLVEMGFNYSEFNMLTDGNIPKKIIHDLKTSFIHAVPISSEQTLVSARSKPTSAYSKAISCATKPQNDTNDDEEPLNEPIEEQQEDLKIQIDDIEVTVANTPYTDATSRDKFMQKMDVLDQEDFIQFKENLGEWIKQEENQPTINVVLEWIVDKLAQSSAEFDENSKLSQLPAFPIKAAIVGKGFSGKSSVIDQLVKNNRCVSIVPQVVINEAVEAYENEEEIEVKVPIVPETISEPKDPSDQNKLDDDKTENQITDINLNSSTNEMPAIKSDEPTENKNTPTGEANDGTNKPEDIDDGDNYEIHMEPTKRAQIGQRIKNELMNGRPISDELLIEVILEYIERIPADQGWIIDDFPSTYNQAMLLEKTALRLHPSSAAVQSSARTSSRKGGKATPAPPKESLFDVVILLDTSDNDCLKRAMMCTQEYNVDNDLEGEDLNNSNSQPQTSSSKDVIANLQTSLSKFTEQWPKLSKFYNKIRDDLIITVNSSEQTNATQVYLNVEEILDKIVDKKKTPPIIETPEIVMEPTEPIESKSEEPQPDESSNMEDQHSKDVLTSKGGTSSKRKSRKSSGKSPRKGSKGSKGSSRASSAGSKSSSTTKKSKKDDDKSQKSTSRKSRTKSRASSGEGKKTTSASAAGKKKKSGSKSSSRSRSGSSKKGKKSKTPTIATEDDKKEEIVPSQPPTPMPGDPEWIFAEKPVEQNIGSALLEFWNNLNSVYETNCKSVFREIRVDREDIIRYIYAIKSAFRQFLDRPDSKQDYLDQFQKEFNELASDWRADPEVIQEIHQQISELKLNLIEISQECHNMAETELESLKKNEWLQDKIGVVTNEYLNLFQHELDRYQDVTRLLRDYYGYLMWTATNKDGNNTKLDEFKPEFLRLPILDIPTTIEDNQAQQSGEENENNNLEQPAETTNSQRQSANAKKENPASANKKGGKQAAANQNATNSGAEPATNADEETEKLFQIEVPMIEYNTQGPQIISTVIANAQTPAKPAAKGDKTAQPISLLKMLANLKPDKKDTKSATERDTTKTPTDNDEKLIYDATNCCVTIINQILEFETMLLNSKDDSSKAGDAKAAGDKGGAAAGKGGKEKAGKEKGGKKSRTPTPKKGGKDKGASSSDKKGKKSRSPSARKGSGKGSRKKSGNKKSPAKEVEPEKEDREQTETPEDKENRLFIEKVKEEYIAALQKETIIIKSAIEHIMSKGIEHIHQLKEKIDGCYELLSVWNADKLVTDEKSIKEIESVLRYHVEKQEPLKDKLQIIGNRFFINPIKEPDETLIPDVPDLPLDPTKPDEFSIHHLKAIFEMFHAASEANSQQIPVFDFNRVLHQVFSSLPATGFPGFIQAHISTSGQAPQSSRTPINNKESGNTPQPPQEPISSILDQFSSVIGQEFSTDNEYVNWKRFLLALIVGSQETLLLSNRTQQDESLTDNESSLWPTIAELLETLERFRVIDQRKSGIVTKEQYEFVDLWFSLDTPVENIEGQKLVNRNAEIKQLIFDVFKQTELIDDDLLTTEHQASNQIEFIDYEDLLIQFGTFCTQDYYEGLGRALSLTVNQPIPAEIFENNDPRNKSNNTERGQESFDDFDIPINALFKILSLGDSNVRNSDEIGYESTDLEDNKTEQEILLLKTLQTIYDNCEETNIAIVTPNDASSTPNQTNIRTAKLQALLAQEGLWEWLHTCDWFKFVNLKSVIQKCIENNQSQIQPIGTASSAAE